MDINVLTQKYVTEDKNWSVAVLMKWLVEKKGVPVEIAKHSLAEVLLEIEQGRDISTHHEFDNYVLQKSREHLTSINQMTVEYLEKNLLRKVVPGGRWSKVWKALTGKI